MYKNVGPSQFIDLTSDDSDDGLLLSSNSNSNSNNIFKQLEGVIDLNEDYHVTPINQVSHKTIKRNRGRPKNILGNTSAKTGIDLRDQVPPTNQKKKSGRPKKMLASTSTRSGNIIPSFASVI
ncbi:dihydroorotate dehydrogenase [Striga asiatica]|uniref:Dihydroorotate dehydrogenase n=1 Tax=Striga asiatica TaxID=4170 RepID=A0A5A7PA81_STRAF|nr:dihydroorotate dehydrogenase [Striga asiatica]